MEELTGNIVRIRTYKSLEEDTKSGYEVPEWCIPTKKKGEKMVEISERDFNILYDISTLIVEVLKYHKEIAKQIEKDSNIETKIQI